MKDLNEGKEVHRQIKGDKELRPDLMLNNILMDMYAKCNALNEAAEIFDSIGPEKDVVSWNIIIAAHIDKNPEKAIALYHRMLHETFIRPDARTFSLMTKVYASQGW